MLDWQIVKNKKPTKDFCPDQWRIFKGGIEAQRKIDYSPVAKSSKLDMFYEVILAKLNVKSAT
jgi:hypothetical protein